MSLRWVWRWQHGGRRAATCEDSSFGVAIRTSSQSHRARETIVHRQHQLRFLRWTSWPWSLVESNGGEGFLLSATEHGKWYAVMV